MWTGQQFSADWALNPSAYQNVAHEDVDWAALAQQWIKMKEATTVITAAPPPPPVPTKIERNEDKGEAPMDMETDEKPSEPSGNNTDGSWNSWPNWGQQQWGWNWQGGPPDPPVGQSKDSYGYTSSNFSSSNNSSTAIDYNHGSNGPVHQPVYWTGQAAGAPDLTAKDQHGRGFVRNSRYSWRRDRERERDKGRSRDREIPEDPPSEEVGETLDAAKRKQLPAWIREGLEKMEREKQKKIDKEKAELERKEYLKKKREEEEEALSKMDKVEAAKFLARSKFDSDDDDDDDDEKELKYGGAFRPRQSRFNSETSGENIRLTKEEKRSPSPTPEPPKSNEELVEEVMLKVRKTLTEILLDVTSQEIQAVAREVYLKARAKAPAKRLRKTQALSSITGKTGLGLGIYGSDVEDSGTDSDGGRDRIADSDEELEETIRRKREAFAKTAKEIEYSLQEELDKEQERERKLEKGRKASSSDDDDDDNEDKEDERIESGQVQERDEKSNLYYGTKKEDSIHKLNDSTLKHNRRGSEEMASVKKERQRSPLKLGSANYSKSRKRRRDGVEIITSDSSSSKSSSISDKRKKKSKKARKSARSNSSDERGGKKKSRRSTESSSDSDRKKSRKRRKKQSSYDSDDDSSSDYAESEENRKRHKHHDSGHRKHGKPEKSRRRDEDKVKKDVRDNKRSREKSEARSYKSTSRRRSRSRESEHRRKRSRSRGSESRYKSHRRSRSRESGHRRRRSKSSDSDSKYHRRSRSRGSDDRRRRRRRSSSNERAAPRRR